MYQPPNNQLDPNQHNFHNDQTTQFPQQQYPQYPQPGQYTQQPYYQPPQQPQKKKWYKTNGGIVLMLFLFFPIGILLMWTNAKWSKNAKWIVTGAFALLFLISGISNAAQSNATNAQQPTAAATAPSHVAQIAVKPTAAPRPTATPAPTAAPTATPKPVPVPTHPPAPVVVPPTQAPAPTAPPVAACSGVIDAGTCYSTDPTSGTPANTVPGDFCSLVRCVSDWNTKQNGSIVQCVNGIYSHSGGVSGACSRDGGVSGRLYRH